MSHWISIDKKRPRLGQNCVIYYVMKRFDGTILRGIKIKKYLINFHDRRRRLFGENYPHFEDTNYGFEDWPVTHWMPLPDPPVPLPELPESEKEKWNG